MLCFAAFMLIIACDAGFMLMIMPPQGPNVPWSEEREREGEKIGRASCRERVCQYV